MGLLNNFQTSAISEVNSFSNHKRSILLSSSSGARGRGFRRSVTGGRGLRTPRGPTLRVLLSIQRKTAYNLNRSSLFDSTSGPFIVPIYCERCVYSLNVDAGVAIMTQESTLYIQRALQFIGRKDFMSLNLLCRIFPYYTIRVTKYTRRQGHVVNSYSATRSRPNIFLAKNGNMPSGVYCRKYAISCGLCTNNWVLESISFRSTDL